MSKNEFFEGKLAKSVNFELEPPEDITQKSQINKLSDI